MNNQQKVWNNIAQEWYKFKTKPSKQTLKFLKNTTGKVLDLGSGAGRHLVKIKKELESLPAKARASGVCLPAK